MHTQLALTLHHQRSSELQRQAHRARLSAAVRDTHHARRLAGRAEALTARSQRLGPQPAGA